MAFAGAEDVQVTQPEAELGLRPKSGALPTST